MTLPIRKLIVIVAIACLTTSATSQVVPAAGGPTGLTGRPMYKSNAGAIVLDKLAEAAALLDALDDQAAALTEVLTEIGAIEAGGALSASQAVMALFGESYEPVPPFVPTDGIYNLPFAPIAADGTVGPMLTSLEGGSALLDKLVLGQVAVDTSILPANMQQDFLDLMGLGVTSQYIYAARFSSTVNPGADFEHFGFAYALQILGQDVITFAPLGEAKLSSATLVDYVQTFATAFGMPIALQPTQGAPAAGPSVPTSPSNPALDECLAAAAAALDAGMQAANNAFQGTVNDIMGDLANYTIWSGWGALAVVGITAAAGIIIVVTGGTAGGAAVWAIGGTAGAGASWLAGVGALTSAAKDQIADAEDQLHDDICNASNAAVQAASACFAAHAPGLKAAFDADAGAALQKMGC